MDELAQVRNNDIGAEPGQGMPFGPENKPFLPENHSDPGKKEGSPAGGSQGAAEPQFLGGALP